MTDMRAQLSFANLAEIETELLAVLAADTQTSKAPDAKPEPVLLTADLSVMAAAKAVLASGEYKAGANETLLLHAPAGLAAKRLLIVGLGKQAKATVHGVRNAAGAAVRFAKPRGIRELAFALPEPASTEPKPAPAAPEPAVAAPETATAGPKPATPVPDTATAGPKPATAVPETAPAAPEPASATPKPTPAAPELETLPLSRCTRAAVEGALLGDFDPDTYRSDRKDQSVRSFTLAASGNSDQDALKAALAEGVIVGESQNFTRSLVNEPGNKLTPSFLGQRAAHLAQEVGLRWSIFSTDKLRDLKMGAFWSVAQGSAEPPALIVLRYEPKGVTEGPVLGLVGKAITFDSGGISIKPSEKMEQMKYDMAGGAAVIGAMRAIALLKPRVRVIAVVCAAENMPSGTAQKPGDVQTAMPFSADKPGKTIEVINTDAEGRMVLADGLTYARQLGATHLIDAATLTGACVVALGMTNAGVFSNDDDAYAKFEGALATSGEKFWRLPLGEEYAELIKSDIGDIKNTGGRYGGAITAAEFLRVFVEDTPWIHLDIAGLAWTEDAKPYIAKGPSGVAVRSILEWVRSYKPLATS
ncbi:MAG TPA: leucyl aminopeptidase [Terracidiphilus sp.]|nr:leucyl aminopeptidase [Terracidiphilus sp.]